MQTAPIHQHINCLIHTRLGYHTDFNMSKWIASGCQSGEIISLLPHLDSPSLISLIVFVDVKHHGREKKCQSKSGLTSDLYHSPTPFPWNCTALCSLNLSHCTLLHVLLGDDNRTSPFQDLMKPPVKKKKKKCPVITCLRPPNLIRPLSLCS